MSLQERWGINMDLYFNGKKVKDWDIKSYQMGNIEIKDKVNKILILIARVSIILGKENPNTQTNILLNILKPQIEQVATNLTENIQLKNQLEVNHDR